MKIQIIGYSGSGKSTLARAMGEVLDLPVLHLDNTKFYGNWQEYSFEEQTAMVEQFLSEHENGWVIDGNYSKIAPRRFSESDMTIFLDFGKVFCYISAWRRYRKNRGRARESCPCVEKFDKEFRDWIWRGSRTPARRQQYRDNLEKTRGEQTVLKNRRQVNRFLNDFRKKYGKR
ncbi:MAG: DNA topology modulation protein FlaR [Clostridia bacterium]|nr:DNA topology modulation protein FlaR [Clostridia bacterium]